MQRAGSDERLHNCALKADGSAYWAPSLYQRGKRIEPSEAYAYYLKPAQPGRVEPYPPGLRMIAGEMSATRAQKGIVDIFCDWDNTLRGERGRPPECGSVLPFDNPDGNDRQDETRIRINFPYCWNGGRQLGSVTYPRKGRCPESHRRLLPQLQLNILYPTSYPGDRLSLSSGSILGAHADFVSGWQTGKLRELIVKCLEGKRRCDNLRDRPPGAIKKDPLPLGEEIRQLLKQGV